MKQKILVIDDEQDIVEIVQYNLLQNNYEVYTGSNGIDAIQYAKLHKPHLILLDINMPHKSGIEACKELRLLKEFNETKIIFLTALASEENEVLGLSLGADDYITKPIKPNILITRIKSALRTQKELLNNEIIYNNLKIDKTNYNLEFNGKIINLARKEFELLSLLASNPKRVFERQEILNKIWGQDVIVGDRTIDVHIRKIRQKLDDKFISTIKGVGYKLEV